MLHTQLLYRRTFILSSAIRHYVYFHMLIVLYVNIYKNQLIKGVCSLFYQANGSIKKSASSFLTINRAICQTKIFICMLTMDYIQIKIVLRGMRLVHFDFLL
jgi:hypothetical protein